MPWIAIVEDEAIVALDISKTLQRRGHEVAGIFDSGEDLLASLETIRPDLILMDVHIKGSLDGIETSAIIHDKYRIPVILLTAHAEADTVARATRSEPYAYILKPFEERELAAAIEVALYRAVMEAKNRDSEEKYRRLFVDGLSAHVLCDSEGLILEANRAFRTLTGMREEEGHGGLSSLFVDPFDWERIKVGLAASGFFPQTELNIRDRGGGIHVVLAQAVRLHSDGRAPDLIQGEFVDLTERRRLEDSLIHAQKMDAVGKLAGGVAHDFNNILTAIIGYADMLAAETELDKTAAEDLHGIRTTAIKAAGLTRQLLAFSRKQPYSPSIFNLNVLVRDSEKMLRRLLPPRITLAVQAYAPQAEVLADSGQIGQALLNLIVNARDAMPEGGSITVRTENRVLSHALDTGRGHVIEAGGYAAVFVADTGPGIPSGLAQSIFQPFFTTKSEGKGTGLGLSIVDSIMRRSKGAVFLEENEAGEEQASSASSVGGPGAKFTLWIPLASELAEGTSVATESANPGNAERLLPPCGQGLPPGKKILIVDDDETIVEVASRMLDRAGFRTIGAVNAGEALLIAESSPASLGLVIADVIMPHMGGETLCQRLVGMIPGLKVLLMSGHPEWIPDSEELGAEGNIFLAKPFTEERLLETVSQVLAARGLFSGASTSR